jgi:hypothetical protein
VSLDFTAVEFETANNQPGSACAVGRPSAAVVRLLGRLAETGTSLHIRADDDTAGQEIVKALRSSIPSTQLWRYDQRPPGTPRYEEQDLKALLTDLDSHPPMNSC